jgi:alkylation response protein AidB-like acyl-CoA dehydrogenase
VPDRAIALHVEGELSAADAARVKLFCTEMQARVVDRCLQLFGGYGYMMEYPIARLYTEGDHREIARLIRAGGATRRWHNNPSAIGAHDIANEIVGELVARLGHRNVVDRTSDRDRCTPVLFRLVIRG